MNDKPNLNTSSLKESFSLLAQDQEKFVQTFYTLLFQRHPGLEVLFENVKPSVQQKKFWNGLQAVINTLDDLESLKKILSEMGRLHQGYGVLEAHYDAIPDILIDSMVSVVGSSWNSDYEEAWRSAMALVSNTMLDGYDQPKESKTMDTKVEDNDELKVVARLKSGIEGSMANLMMCDENRDIVYLNPAFLKLMEHRGGAFSEAFPGFDPDNILGQNIDQFHHNPAHQKALLADESRLPYSTEVKIKDLNFSLNATMIKGPDGEYMGNMLEWTDITETVKKERETARLQSGIEGSMAKLMMCDENRDIVYLNPAFLKLMEHRGAVFSQAFPGFDPDNILGQNIDQFHKNPAHQIALLADENRLPYSAEIKVMDLTFSLNATMVKGPNGEYMGNMLEWTDVTSERDAEKQIRTLVKDAARGEFTARLDAEAYEGFFKQMSELLNDLMSNSERSLTDIAGVIKQLAKGDLTGNIEADYQGLFGELKCDVNSTVENLRSMVENITDSAYSISDSASEISQGNNELSHRTEAQASSLEETASSMEQMTSAVKSNADNSRQASQLASGAREQATAGGQVVDETVKAMTEISSSSGQITEIITVIDEIAFQTNLLALNAAVEAARAGEQGRGFAVVASEVRNLAQRSAEAAKEIKSLIKNSAEKVSEGSRLVGESGQTLEEIVTAVKKVCDIISEIAAASQEQSDGIEQVNKAIAQLDEVTQQNASLVEEAAASSETMDGQAQNLNKLVGHFNMGKERKAPAPTRKPAAKSTPTPTKKAQASEKRPFTEEHAEEWEEF